MMIDLDMGRWLREEPIQVFATGSALADPKIEKDIDTAVAVLRTASGRLCQITNSRRCCYGYDQRIEVFGSEGMVRADNQKDKVEKATTEGFTTEPALPFFLERYAKAYRIQLDRFMSVDTVSICRSVLMDWNSQRLRRNRLRPVERSRSATQGSYRSCVSTGKAAG